MCLTYESIINNWRKRKIFFAYIYYLYVYQKISWEHVVSNILKRYQMSNFYSYKKKLFDYQKTHQIILTCCLIGLTLSKLWFSFTEDIELLPACAQFSILLILPLLMSTQEILDKTSLRFCYWAVKYVNN